MEMRNKSGDARAIDLRNAIEINDDLMSAGLSNRFESVVELLTGVANGQAASHLENRDGAGLPNSYLHWWMLGHNTSLEILILAAALSPALLTTIPAADLHRRCIIRWQRREARRPSQRNAGPGLPG